MKRIIISVLSGVHTPCVLLLFSVLALFPSLSYSAVCQSDWDYEEYHLTTYIGGGCGSYGMIEDWIAANPGGGYTGYQCGLNNGNYVYGLWSVTWIYPADDSDCDGIADTLDSCPDTVAETEVDSSGCPLDPAHCSDGGSVATGDETGVDCGGSCAATCELVCSDGLEPISDPESPWFNKCYGGIFPLTSQGICPPNTVLGTLGESCVGVDEPFNVSTEFTPSEIAAMGVEPTDYNLTGTNIFTDENSSWVSVDNGDGTSTETTTTTTAKTDSDGNDLGSETTTRTDIVNNTTSTIVSSTISTTTTTTPEENPDNFLGFGDVETGGYDADLTEDIPESSSMTNLIDGFITTSPIFSLSILFKSRPLVRFALLILELCTGKSSRWMFASGNRICKPSACFFFQSFKLIACSSYTGGGNDCSCSDCCRCCYQADC